LIVGDNAAVVASLIIRAWDEIKGTSAEKTTADKLIGRIDLLGWQPPNLTFRLARHGPTVLGLTRERLHHWQVNTQLGVACLNIGAFRQVSPRAPAKDFVVECTELVKAIKDPTDHPALTWREDRAQFHVGKIVPDAGPRQTVAGWRKRFGAKLESALKEIGWQLQTRGSKTFIEESDGATG
jgi:hypothetical protein